MRGTNTIKGKGFEYATLRAFSDFLVGLGASANVVENPAYETALISFKSLNDEEKREYLAAGAAAVQAIVPLEPNLSYGLNSPISLSVQEDARGQKGDVRDIVLSKEADKWEIGISCKHNHEALKHPRVTKDGDFGTEWIGTPCSANFLFKIQDIFKVLESWTGTKWNSHSDKFTTIYLPILRAFGEEIERLCEIDSEAPRKLLNYFFGVSDFYKVIARDRRAKGLEGTTKVVAFNILGTLGQKAPTGERPTRAVPRVNLPTKLFNIDIKKDSFTTLELTFDKGWALSMRLHNADSIVKTTGLKWDIQLIGEPSEMVAIEQPWT